MSIRRGAPGNCWWRRAGTPERVGLLLGATVALAAVPLAFPHAFEFAPSPRGARFSVRLPEASGGITLAGGAGWVVDVRPLRARSAIELRLPARGDEGPLTRVVHVPTGRVVSERVGRRSSVGSNLAAGGAFGAPFDLDGDGTPDRLESVVPGGPSSGAMHRVLSGTDGSVLYDLTEEDAWHPWNELLPLGDLDGDGFAELAVVYPRRRSGSLESAGSGSGPSSWLVVVSGSEL